MKLHEELKFAQNKHKALLAANFYNYETCKGIVLAASELELPIILQVTPGSIEYMGLKTAAAIARTVSCDYNVKAWLHLDHCGDKKLIKECLDEGFDSVMIDASETPLGKNIEITREVVKTAEPYKVNVEAELGYVPKPDNDVQDDKFTNPAEAKRFVEETGVSSLAVAIGSKHGFYKGEARLDIDRLKAIFEITDTCLVLHGGSGISPNILINAIRNGICKVNVATETKDIFMRTLKEVIAGSSEIDLRKVFPLGITEVKNLIKTKLKIVNGIAEN